MIRKQTSFIIDPNKNTVISTEVVHEPQVAEPNGIVVDVEPIEIMDDCTECTMKLFREKKISAEFAANNIVSDIRHYLICNINDTKDSCGIGDVQYLDEVLFNDLKVLIIILLTNGKNDDVISLIKKRIDTTCYDVDYSLNDKYKKLINDIIEKRLYRK